MILEAAGPAEWAERHFGAVFTEHRPAADGTPHERWTTEHLLDVGLRTATGRLIADGTPRAATGMWLAGWYGGGVAWYLGHALLAADAALLLDRVDFLNDPDGYPDALVVGPGVRAAVLPGHPWAGRPEVEVVSDRRARAERLAAGMIATVAPILSEVQRLTRAGPVGMWHEVGDAFASAAAYQEIMRVGEPELDGLREVLDLPAMPWRRRPRLALVEYDGAPACVMHKGGCCLAYTVPANEATGEPAGEYCTTCRFRSFEDAVALQLG